MDYSLFCNTSYVTSNKRAYRTQLYSIQPLQLLPIVVFKALFRSASNPKHQFVSTQSIPTFFSKCLNSDILYVIRHHHHHHLSRKTTGHRSPSKTTATSSMMQAFNGCLYRNKNCRRIEICSQLLQRSFLSLILPIS